jgi:hypothetical protein
MSASAVVAGLAAVVLAGCMTAPQPERRMVTIETQPQRMILRGAESAPALRRDIEQAVFVLLDVDGDEKISRSEVTRLPELAQSFGALDADLDAALDRIEFRVAMAAAFWGIGNVDRTPVRGQ